MRASWRSFRILIAAVLLVPLLAPSASAPGSAFAANVKVNDDYGTTEQRRAALVADVAGIVYAAWQDARSGDFDIRFAVSRDGGRTFGASIRLGGDRAVGTTQERPALALGPAGEIVAVWQDDRAAFLDIDIYASVSVDAGSNFSEPHRVSDGPAGSLQFAPSVAVDDGGRVFVAWQDHRSGNGDLRLARAQLPDLTFGPSVRVDDDGGRGTQAAPSVAVNGLGTVFVAYHDNRTGNANVYLARSSDHGGTFSPSVRVDDAGDGPTGQGLVSLAADGLGTLYAVWQDGRNGDYDIHFAMSTDGGRSFGPSVRVDDGSRGTIQSSARIALGAAGRVYVVWEDTKNLDSDVYFSYSVDGGRTFASSVRMDDAGDDPNNPAYQYSPQVAEPRTGFVAAAWHDGRSDNGDIYSSAAYLGLGSAFRADVSLSPRSVAKGEAVDVTVRVTSNGTGTAGAAIALTADAPGTFEAVVDEGGGLYRSRFVPNAGPEGAAVVLPIAVTAIASKTGFAAGGDQALLEVGRRVEVYVGAPWDVLYAGQTMDVWVRLTSSGSPIAGAALALTASGLDLAASGGMSDASGTWSTKASARIDAGGTTATLSVGASKDGFLPGTATSSVAILEEARPLAMTASSNRREMMSYETATIRIQLSSDGAAVPHALISASSLKGGNFSAAVDHGDGTYALTFDAPRVTTQSWLTISLSARAGGYADARTRFPVLIDPNQTNPPDPTPILLLAEPASTTVRAGDSVAITLWIYTPEGYVVSGARVEVAVGASYGRVTTARDELEGRYTFTYTAAALTTDTVVLIRISAAKYGYQVSTARLALLVTP